MLSITIIVDAWHEDGERKTKATDLLETVHALRLTQNLDLSRLEGITVTTNLDEALANFDDGGIKTGRTLTRSTGDTVGVAMTPVCKRGESAMCRIFLSASTVSALNGQSDVCTELYILAHELGHAHDLAKRCQHLEPHVLQTPGDLLTPPVFWQLAEICWNEYAACRLSALTCPEMTAPLEEMLVQALRNLRPCLRQNLRNYSPVPGPKILLNDATAPLCPVLKAASYFLGHRAGLGNTTGFSAALTDSLDANGFLQKLEELCTILADMWEAYPDWTNLDVYEPLIEFLKGFYTVCALDVYEENGQAKVRVNRRLMAAILQSS